jgi:hypothetical protein
LNKIVLGLNTLLTALRRGLATGVAGPCSVRHGRVGQRGTLNKVNMLNKIKSAHLEQDRLSG